VTSKGFRAPLRQANNEQFCLRAFVSYLMNPPPA
jgi:hypothetical protein